MECQYKSFNLIELEDESAFTGGSMERLRGQPSIVTIERNNSAPQLSRRENQMSDIVAIKRGNGEVAFVAVGRKKSQESQIRKLGCTKNLRNDSAPQSSRAIMGIDNLGYTTVTRGDTYRYDQTGVTCANLINLDDDCPALSPAIVVDTPVDEPYNAYQYDEQEPATFIRDNSNICHQNDHELFVELNPPNDDVFTQEEEEPGSSVAAETTPPSEVFEQSEGPSPIAEEAPSKLPPYCKSCGQRHGVTENHEFNYVDEVDDDLTCDICLQPLVDPYDTKCGHTFCCICIKNYLRIKHMCPIDRQEMENTASDCWQSSLLLQRLINKLIVTCPNEKYCKTSLQRSNLKDHLKDYCPGAIIKCSKSIYGCSFKSPKLLMEQHAKNCDFKDLTDDLSDLHPFCDNISLDIFRPEGTAELGLSIVGGSDTPIHYIIIQDIILDSIAYVDGRLRPGDTIVDINGESMYSVTHSEARAALTKPSNVMHLEVLREVSSAGEETQASDSTRIHRSSSMKSCYDEEAVCLIKPPLEQLGIRISTSETGAKGVYIIELIDGQVAHADGRLQVGDRIMAIGNTDLTDSTPDRAARIIGSCAEEVEIVVRHPVKSPGVLFNQWAQEKEKNSPRFMRSVSSTPTSSVLKKMISVKKSPKENLGIVVSGGFNSSRGNLPIFVQDVLPMSLLGKDKRIKRGDLLLQINSVKLVGLNHSQAMNILREAAQQSEIDIVAYELEYEGMAEDASLWDELTSLHQHPTKWAPSWKMWLSVTPEFLTVRNVMMRKTSSSSYGIKFTGGNSPEIGPQPVFITHVCPKSAASKYLKSGDEIIAINRRYVKGMQHTDILLMLKTMNSVTLKVVSWPGSLH